MKMYKVMIIDDEPIIVEGLSRSVAWEKYDCHFRCGWTTAVW